MFWTCGNCEAKVSKGDSYCNGCGSRLNWACVAIVESDMTFRGEVPA